MGERTDTAAKILNLGTNTDQQAASSNCHFTHTHTHTHKGSLLTTKQEALESVWVVQKREKSLAPARK